MPPASKSVLEEPWRTIYSLNPMATIIEGFRWSLVGGPDSPDWRIVPAALTSVVLLVTGLYYFRRAEGAFADVV